jgi:hypothetical protein
MRGQLLVVCVVHGVRTQAGASSGACLWQACAVQGVWIVYDSVDGERGEWGRLVESALREGRRHLSGHSSSPVISQLRHHATCTAALLPSCLSGFCRMPQ